MSPHETKAAVKDILRGFGRGNEAALVALQNVDDWQRIARAELERRATAIVQALDDDTLRAIAAGEIDLPALCREVAADLAPKAA